MQKNSASLKITRVLSIFGPKKGVKRRKEKEKKNSETFICKKLSKKYIRKSNK
jgi:hypothetical protein